MMKRTFLIISIVFAYSWIPTIAEIHDAVPGYDRLVYWCEMSKGKTSNDEYIHAYRASMDSLDVAVNSPEGFQMTSDPDAESRLIFSPDPQYRSDHYDGQVGTSLLGPVFESDVKDALIVYPLAIDFIGMSPDYMMETELIAATGNDSINITPLINMLRNPDNINSDKTLVYEYEVKNPLWSDHNHCVALALRNKNHYAFPIKIFLNDEGLKNKEKYIEVALNSVRYGDQPKAEWIESENLVRPDEGVFPMKKPVKCHHHK